MQNFEEQQIGIYCKAVPKGPLYGLPSGIRLINFGLSFDTQFQYVEVSPGSVVSLAIFGESSYSKKLAFVGPDKILNRFH